MTANGLITVKSAHPALETIDRLEFIIKAKGLLVFGRIDHSANATSVGMTLRPTILLIFGHPKGGTPLMQGGGAAAAIAEGMAGIVAEVVKAA